MKNPVDIPVIYKKVTCFKMIKKIHSAQLRCGEAKLMLKDEMPVFCATNIGVEIFNDLDDVMEKLDNLEFFLSEMTNDSITLVERTEDLQ